MVIILISIMVAAFPVIYLTNSRYIQRIVLFIGASQIALLAFAGKLDNQLSDILVDGFSNFIYFPFNVVV